MNCWAGQCNKDHVLQLLLFCGPLYCSLHYVVYGLIPCNVYKLPSLLVCIIVSLPPAKRYLDLTILQSSQSPRLFSHLIHPHLSVQCNHCRLQALKNYLHSSSATDSHREDDAKEKDINICYSWAQSEMLSLNAV